MSEARQELLAGPHNFVLGRPLPVQVPRGSWVEKQLAKDAPRIDALKREARSS